MAPDSSGSFHSYARKPITGEVRPVPGISRRIQEAERLGFTHAVVPESPNGPGRIPAGFTVKQVSTLTEALELLF